MGRWGDLLDSIADGAEPSIPFMDTLPLPKTILKWEPGRLWQEWKVDPSVFHPRGAVFGSTPLSRSMAANS